MGLDLRGPGPNPLPPCLVKDQSSATFFLTFPYALVIGKKNDQTFDFLKTEAKPLL